MKTATRIVFNFIREEHPLGQIINREDVPKLTSQLGDLLGMSERELNFTPVSLKRLEEKLTKLSQKNHAQDFTDEEIVQLVREIGAYVGEVLVLHAKGKWRTLNDLWSTHVIIETEVIIIKEGRRRIVPSIAFSLGAIGCAAWDMISLGRKPSLYKDYQNAKTKVMKEEWKRNTDN